MEKFIKASNITIPVSSNNDTIEIDSSGLLDGEIVSFFCEINGEPKLISGLKVGDQFYEFKTK